MDAAPTLCMEELEPRLLLSADAGSVLFGAALWTAPEAPAFPDLTGPYPAGELPTTSETSPELLFVDTTTPDYAQLLDDVLQQNGERPFQVIMLDPARDGVEQIGATLATRHDVPAIHIIGHGAEGRFLLGSGELSAERIARDGAELTRWANALSADADILLYGCDLAAGADGRAMVEGLAQATGADVAASNDLTGNAALGGDWDLEFQAGRIDTPVAFSQELRHDWAAVLSETSGPPYVVSNTGSTASEGGTDTITAGELTYASGSHHVTVVNYSVTAGPSNGRLELSTNPGVSITTFAQTDITANRLRYVHDGSSTGSDGFTFNVSNSGGTTANQSFAFTVTQVNDAPVVNNQSFSANENSANGTVVGTVAATDEDGNPLSYSITAGNTGNAFAINATTGQITVNNTSQLNFEATPSFGLTIQVSDGSLTDTAAVTINLNNVNDAPVVNNQSFGINENSANGTVVGSVAATDADGNTLTYSITAGNTSGAFAINATTGQITVSNTSALNFETTPSFGLTVQVQDNGTGTLTDTATVTINLANVNDAPVVNDQSFSIDENSANGVVVGSVAATDADGNTLTYSITAGNTSGAFAINAATGQITVSNTSALNFETTPSFGLTVQVQDNGTGTLTDTAAVTITLNNVNETPVINNQSFSVNENSANGTVVGTAVATDPDGNTLTYSITAGNTGGAFAINAATGQITVNNASALDFETTPSFGLTVQVQDNGTGTLTDTATVTINLTNVNDAPVVNNQSFGINENSANGSVVGSVAATDADGNTLTYSITAGNTNNAFVINATTGQITVNNASALDFETTPSFGLTVQVQDNGTGTLTDTATITINLNNVNDAPVVNNQSFGIDENSANGAVVGMVAASDADGNTLTYSITAGNTGGAFAINAATGQITVSNTSQLNFESTPSFGLTVQVQDNGTGTLTDTATVTINLNDVNETPVFNDQTFTLQEASPNGTVVGVAVATDPDGDILNYSITGGDPGGVFSIDANTGQITVADSASLSAAPSSYTLTVQAGDGSLNDTATLTVNISAAPNQAPVVNNQGFSVDENSANGTVVGSVAATDADADTLSYSITAGNTNNAFTINATTGQITVNDIAALDFETTPSFGLTVQVSDGSLTDTATVTITLNDINDAPLVNDQGFNVDESSANGTVVGTVAATDADVGDTLTYSITAGNTNNAFAIDPVTGEITVSDSAQIHFEITPTFTLTVQVQDNGTGTLTDTATVTINLNDINDAPVINDQSFSADENSANGTVVGSVAATDADVGDTLTYSITAGNTGNAFAIDPVTGEITVNDTSALDFETTPSFGLTIQVQDNGVGTLTDTATVTITLNDVNEVPVINNQNFGVDENSANGSVVGTVAASDTDGDTLTYSITAGNTGNAFAIDPVTGEITVNDIAALDFETTPSFGLTVQVQDNGTGTLTDTATVTITLNDINDAPVVNDQSFGVDENSANGTVVGTVAATDADVGDTLTYSITAGNTNNAFAIDPVTGEITVNDGTQIDFETTPTFTLTVQAQDNGAGTLTDTATVTINLNDINDAPVMNDQSFGVDENSANGTVVGTVATTDADVGDTLTYSITAGNTGNAFAIDPVTGEITVNDGTQIDFETTPTFTLTVQVQDNGTGTLTDTATVTINLTNVNDVPVVNNQNFGVDENSANGTVVGTVAATDTDGDTLTYSITAGNTNNAFVIDPVTGEITVNDTSALDFETNPTFNLTVQVQDNGTGTLTDTATVTVTLNNVNDAPVVNNHSFSVDEGSANGTVVGSVAATDADGDTLTYSIVAGNHHNAFAIDPVTGQITISDGDHLDYETATSEAFTVQVRDSGTGNLVATSTITINIGDVYEATPIPPVTDAIDPGVLVSLLAGNDTVSTPGTVQISVPEPDLAPPPTAGNPGAVPLLAEVAVFPGSHGPTVPFSPHSVRFEPVALPVDTDVVVANSPANPPPVHASETPSPAVDRDALWRALDRMEVGVVDMDTATSPLLLGLVRGVAWGLSAGFLAWILRAGSLVATAMTSLPLWKWFDPLPVLVLSRREREERKRRLRAEEQAETRQDARAALILDKEDPRP